MLDVEVFRIFEEADLFLKESVDVVQKTNSHLKANHLPPSGGQNPSSLPVSSCLVVQNRESAADIEARMLCISIERQREIIIHAYVLIDDDEGTIIDEWRSDSRQEVFLLDYLPHLLTSLVDSAGCH